MLQGFGPHGVWWGWMRSEGSPLVSRWESGLRMWSSSPCGGCHTKGLHRAQPPRLGKNTRRSCSVLSCKSFVQKKKKSNLNAKCVCWGDCALILLGPRAHMLMFSSFSTCMCAGDTLCTLLRLLLRWSDLHYLTTPLVWWQIEKPVQDQL